MEEKEYPKWVQRDPSIGKVLCLNADEEKSLLDAWAQEQKQEVPEVQEVPEAPRRGRPPMNRN